MTGISRLRKIAPVVFAAGALAAIAACSGPYPNTTFTPHSELGREIDSIWDRLLLLGTIVFILVEAALLFVVFKYRKSSDEEGHPPQTHGHALLEIIWTIIPAIILVFIAVPTVRTIFKTQARVAAGALEIDVIGHQWWWEFRYPEYGVVTANEIYLPTGRTVNFRITSVDVIHSFWIPQLSGKRDAVTNRTNYIWFTPDSTMETAEWNGFCTEYCGDSHAKMRFRVFTVKPDQFASWVAGQQRPAQFGAVANAPPPIITPFPRSINERNDVQPKPNPVAAPAPNTTTATSLAPGYTVPRNQPEFAYTVPHTPVPGDIKFTAGLTGNAARGQQVFSSSACIGCHTVTGNPMAMGVSGPNLTHFGSRATIGAGNYPNTPAYLALWVKNARKMKPGVIMPTMGKGEYDPQIKATATTGALDDQQIADIVAYLTSLK